MDGMVIVAAMPRHFAIAHRVVATRDHTVPVTRRIDLSGAAVTRFGNVDWLDGQRALRLSDASGQGWVTMTGGLGYTP